MANYEFKTEKCYPSQAAEQAVVNMHRQWGWEITDIDSNKQVFEKQDADGTQHFSTSSYIKMRREFLIQKLRK